MSYLIIFVLLLTLLGSVFYYRTKIENLNFKLESLKSNLKLEKDNSEITFKTYLLDNNTPIKLSIYNYSNINPRSTFKIDKLKFPLLVYRFSELNCSSCVESALKITSDFFRDKYAERVLFLIDGRNQKYLDQFMRLNKIKNIMLSLRLNELPLSAENSSQPYMFVLNSENTAHHIFFPDKQNDHQTEEYLKAISAKYFD